MCDHGKTHKQVDTNCFSRSQQIASNTYEITLSWFLTNNKIKSFQCKPLNFSLGFPTEYLCKLWPLTSLRPGCVILRSFLLYNLTYYVLRFLPSFPNGKDTWEWKMWHLQHNQVKRKRHWRSDTKVSQATEAQSVSFMS